MAGRAMTLQSSILTSLEGLETSIPQRALHVAVDRARSIQTSVDEFGEAILSLQRLSQVEVIHPQFGAPRVRLALNVPNPAAHAINLERDLEAPFEQFLWRNFRERFAQVSNPANSLIVQNTARGGTLGGVWKNPDLTAAVVSRYEYFPTPILDLVGFELKLASYCSVPSVHEALSHTAHVHFSYLVVYSTAESPVAGFHQVLSQAQAYGIGVITTSDPNNDAAYQTHLEAQRKEPSPKRIDEFLRAKFHRTHQDVLKSWLGI
jgi:hypothetical protein